MWSSGFRLWAPHEVEAVIDMAIKGGVASSGNIIPKRPSIALAVMIAYDTSLPQQDILDLRWDQFDGEGVTVTQKKCVAVGRYGQSSRIGPSSS